MTLDEKSLRKPGFALGTKVTLADGQEWMLPKPKLRFKPKIINGRVEISGGPSFGPEFDDKLDRAVIDAKLGYLRRRRAMSTSPLVRLPAIASELLLRRYHKYSWSGKTDLLSDVKTLSVARGTCAS
jgi:hypothetical protein